MAKICPKCGREYEGDSCPYCEKPKILVNQEAYEKRRAAYERSQDSLNKKNNRRRGRNGRRTKKKPAASKTLRALNAALDFLYEKIQDFLYVLGKFGRRFRKQILTAAAVCLLLLICVSAGRGIWTYTHTHLWVYADGTTSQVESDSLKDVSDGRTTFWSDSGKAYFSALPGDMAGETLKVSAVSENGRYFAAVFYTGGRNVICRWKSGNPDGYEKLATEDVDVELAGIADDGACFYLLNPSSEENWAYSGSGATAYFARASGGSVRVDINVTQFHGTPEDGSAVYIRDGVLYKFSSDSRGAISTTEIAERASDLQVPDPGKTGVYTQAGGTVLRSGSSYIYRSDGTYYISDGRTTEKIWDSTQSLTFFMKGDTAVYAAGTSGIFTEDNGVLVQAADTRADSAYVWIADKKKLLFTDEQGEICMLSGRKLQVLSDSLTGAMSYVTGFDGAAVMTDSGVYLISLSGEQTQLSGAGNADQVIVFRGKTYAAGSDGQLLIFDRRGNATSPGAAVKIWIQK